MANTGQGWEEKERLYSQKEVETITAVTAEFFADKVRADQFYDNNGEALSGIVGVWEYVRFAALTLEKESRNFGEAGVDFDWLQATADFAAGLYKYKNFNGELQKWAKEVLENSTE